jgi:hypothetical protein
MHKMIKRMAFVILIYFVSWTASYSVIMGFDFRYYFEYLHLAWTHPGENPAFIHIIAIALTMLTVVIAFSFKRKKQ